MGLNEKQMEKLRECGMLNMPLNSIAVLLKISESSLERILKKNAAAREAKDGGRAETQFAIRRTILSLATGQPAKHDQAGNVVRKEQKPDITAARYWADTQEGFKSSSKLELVGKDDSKLEGIVVQIVEPKTEND